MIKTLRLKFIAVSMFSTITVLFIIVGSINILNYRNMIRDADDTLAILASNNGSFPRIDRPLGPNDKNSHILSPETPFEVRYFSVLLTDEGTAISVDTGKIAAIDAQTAIHYAESVWRSPGNKGFLSEYRYRKQSSDDGIRIIFLYCSRSLLSFRAFLFSSILVSILGILTVLLLVILLSKKVIKPLSDSYDKQRRFITDAGHELKTPLTIIDADLCVLEMEFGENEWTDDIRLQTKRLTKLTNDLVYLSRMEENKNHIAMIDFPISDVIAEAAQSFQSLVQIQKKQFRTEIEPMLSFYGDEKSVRQLIFILLDNALKYSDEKGEISLTVEKKGKNIHITVFNTTQSIPPENLSQLFERFYRSDQSRNSETGGYGIGLSIARAIVLAHKGRITASSKDGRSLQILVIL